MNDRFLKLEAVVAITSLSVSELYRRINAGTFPRAIVLGPKTKAWSEAEVNAWLARARETVPREQAGVSDELAAAVRLRDLVLPILRAHGTPDAVSAFEGIPLVRLAVGETRLALLGPFQFWSSTMPRAAIDATGPVFHRLEAANPDGLRLALGWGGDGAATLDKFTRGRWENDLLAALALLPQTPERTQHEQL